MCFFKAHFSHSSRLSGDLHLLLLMVGMKIMMLILGAASKQIMILQSQSSFYHLLCISNLLGGVIGVKYPSLSCTVDDLMNAFFKTRPPAIMR